MSPKIGLICNDKLFAICEMQRGKTGPLWVFLLGFISGAGYLWGFSSPTWADTGTTETIVEHINRQIYESWQENEVTPSPPCSDGKWCRRVYLDILGRIPSIEELTEFVGDRSSDKKTRLVDLLLSDSYAQEYARNWTTNWTNILIGRSGGTERRTRTNRDGMRQYLYESLLRNKPYDQLVYELISARGTSKPDVDNFNGAVNFLAMKLEEEAVQATAKTAQIFMGIRVQCTQCHPHPFNSWKQNQFWELNAFFRQTVALRRFEGGRDITYIDLQNQDYQGPTGDPQEAELFYDKRNGERIATYPIFTDSDGKRTELDRNGFIDEVNRREELAKLVTKSGYLPTALVNRMWAHFLGLGFTKPFDDMGPHNRPSHPELLKFLGQTFRDSGYDLKELIRWIVLSDAYSLSSRFNSGNTEDDPLLGNPPMFSRYYPRQMLAEELYESLLKATKADKTKASAAQQDEDKERWLRQFSTAFGTDENDELNTFNGTIPQSLMLFNGDLVKRATSTAEGSFLDQISNDEDLSNTEKINRLFEAALARKASRQERKWATTIILRNRESVAEALQDIWWALLNTNEFILKH